MISSSLELNVAFIRKKVTNVREAARSIGVRQATLSDLITGKTRIEKAEVGTLDRLAQYIGCEIGDLLLRKSHPPESSAESMPRWSHSGTGTRAIKGYRVEKPAPESERIEPLRNLPDPNIDPSIPLPQKRRRRKATPRILDKTEILRTLKDALPTLRSQYSVRSLALFGSYARGEARKQSDVDVLVEFDETPGLLRYGALEHHLSELLGAKVDLVMKSGLRPMIGKRILSEMILI